MKNENIPDIRRRYVILGLNMFSLSVRTVSNEIILGILSWRIVTLDNRFDLETGWVVHV